MNRVLKWLCFCALLAAAPARAQIGLSTPDGPDRTCPRFKGAQPAGLRTDADRVAFAICNGIDTSRAAARRLRRGR